MMYTVYILISESNGKKYIGYTENVENRIKEHNSKRGISRFTKNKGIWKLLYKEDGYKTKEEAIRREREIKKMKGGIQLKALLKHAGIV